MRKILKYLFVLFLLFSFKNNVNASAEYKLQDSYNNPVTCVYKNSDNGYSVKLEYKNNKTYVYLNNNLVTDISVNNKIITDQKKCPKKIEFSSDESGNSTVDFNITKVYCGRDGQGRMTGIPKKIPELTSMAITIIQIAVPVILILMGSLDLFKGVTAGKEDEIKKGQQMFIKRLTVGAVIFFVVIIVKFFISVIADTNETNIVDCIDCFVSNNCKEDV